MVHIHDILGKDAPREPMPDWVAPMLATLTHDLRARPGWRYERKYDGERCLAYRRDGVLSLWSRNRHALDGAYPEIAAALDRPGPDFILDGEITAAQGSLSDFQVLQKRMQISDPAQARASGIRVFYNLFDLLHYDGVNLRPLPQHQRKQALQALIPASGGIEVATSFTTWSPEFQHEICARGWEGLIAKDPDAPYVSRRARSWLKYKCAMSQAFVIAGYTDPKGSRVGFGALLLGVCDDAGQLHYAGKVGTGFDDELLRDLAARMKPLEVPRPAFVDPPRATRGVHWLSPALVAEVGFSEWTDAGRLRHPRFLGLRDDKAPWETRREDPE